MKYWINRWIAVIVVAGLAGSAGAHKVYFNGVEVEAGLAGQTFAGVEVRFDEAGNVWITAKGYSVKVMDGKKKVVAPVATPMPSPTPTPAQTPTTAKPGNKTKVAPQATSDALTKHYYVVAMQSRIGAAQYDIDVFVNGKWVKKVRAKDAHVVVDITPQIRLGQNSVHFAAVKNYDGDKRFSTSPNDTMSVILGEGTMAAGTCMIDTPLAKLDVSAADTQSQAADAAFTGR